MTQKWNLMSKIRYFLLISDWESNIQGLIHQIVNKQAISEADINLKNSSLISEFKRDNGQILSVSWVSQDGKFESEIGLYLRNPTTYDHLR